MTCVKYGEEVMVWVRLKEGATAGAEEIRAFCRGRIAHFKVPAYVKLVDAYPMTVSGKIQKYRLRELAIQELGLQDAAAVRTA
jgi:fatty-acyl-CoA synthase